MASEPEVCFRDVLSFAIGGGWGQEEATAKESELVRVIRGTDIPSVNARRFREIPTRYETPSKVEKRRLRSGDIVLEISGGSSSKGQPTGRTVFIDDEVLDGLTGTAIPASFCRLVRVDARRVLPKFAYYWLQEMYVSGRAFAYENQSTGISNFQFERFLDAERLALPSMSMQEEIAAALSPIEARQRLLRQSNASLEAIAQALFKSWFIDFDPVRAKAEGRDPEGMDPATAALFPSEFEDSPLGLIPKGWRVGTVREVCSAFDSKRIPLSGKERAERQGPYPYYGAAALMDHVDDFLFDGVYLLLGEDGSVTNKDGTPITQYVWGKFWVNNHAHVLQGAHGVRTEHLMLALRGMDFTPYVTGAVQAKLNQSNLYRVPFLRADSMVSEAFGLEVEPLYRTLRANSEQAMTLATLRDTLLPRLISGKLRLPEAERQVDGALA
jgi:type I restriction enzyme S subunit